MRMSPWLGCSRPAISRSRVVLPHPDGPSRTRYSPSPVSKSMPSTAMVCPNSLRSDMVSTTAMGVNSVLGASAAVFLHQALGPPFAVNCLALARRGCDRRLWRRLSLGRVGHHGREDISGEDLSFRRVGRARVPDVSRPLLGGGQQRELVRRLRPERIV